MEAQIEGGALSAIGLAKDAHATVTPCKLGGGVERLVFRTIVHHEDLKIRVVEAEDRTKRRGDTAGFVVGGNQDRHAGPTNGAWDWPPRPCQPQRTPQHDP